MLLSRRIMPWRLNGTQIPLTEVAVLVKDCRKALALSSWTKIPLSSANSEFQDLLERKKRLIVCNKMDLANPNMTLKWESHFQKLNQRLVFVNAHQTKSVRKMLEVAWDLLREKLAKEPTLLLMIVGIPNVGKSALINTLFRHAHAIAKSEQEHLKKAKVGPLPGVTQHISGFKIGEKPSVYVLDTPGVLVPNIDNIDTGLKLALTGAVKDSVVGEERVARYLLSVLNARSSHLRWTPELSQAECDTSEIGANVRNVIAQTCLKFDGNLEDKDDMESLVDEQMITIRRIFKVPSEVGDDGWIRVSKQLLKLFRTGRLGRFTLDPVPVMT
ncbi:short integuments 2, mitochondrial isoform X2 [Physcomitrium patens]|uniref:G domain-containing protein n=1 Tax=Physcomitrium patens TaxID=3218 RepID=A0A7I4B974_PHYPA|nr:short integuments 2, mitochondrial-like isoform X2 [Physcomitrium patens]|eukprot:XP_024399902.1 short integuments 2, mitochondrial-like isoform X2 [Physcomitrella patens]